ncbi:hypothetical protein F3D3_4484 [Fusibacter sp. 3D3]|nr:hypothetical protein F3D3_4484 [Fusibacter sp. 3D3]
MHIKEEYVVFPLVKENVKGEDADVVLEMIEEHSLGMYRFSVLEKTSVENETWDTKFSVLKEVLEHHMEEEEKSFIPLAKKVVPKEHLTSILEAFEKELGKYKKEKTTGGELHQIVEGEHATDIIGLPFYYMHKRKNKA